MKKFIVIIAAVFLSGCTSFNVPTYSADSQNIESIGGRPNKFNIVSDKPSFEDTGKILCRMAGDITVLKDKTYNDYLLDALREELTTRKLLDDKNDRTVSVKFTKVNLSSSLGSTRWFIDGEYNFNGKTQLVSTVYDMDSNYFADVACNNIALNFPKAVTQHLGQLYKSSVFIAAAGDKQAIKPIEDPNVRLEKLKKAFDDKLITDDEYKAKRSQILQDF